LFVPAVVFGGVFVFAALEKGGVFGGADEYFWIAESEPGGLGEALGSLRKEHHVRAGFPNFAGEADGIFEALETRGGSGAESGAVHDDGVAFDLAIEIEMGAEAGVEGGIVLEDDDGGFDGV
jgi:hypothetical protein